MNKIKSFGIYLIPIPFVLNFILNLNKNNHLFLGSLILGFFCFLFLYLIGKELNEALGLGSISLSITFYLMFAFTLNFVLLPLDRLFLNFQEMILIYNTLVVLFIFFKKKNPRYLLFALILLFVLRNIITVFDFDTSTYIQYSSDVSEFWLPMSNMIYSNDLYFSIQNNIMPGYSLLINFVYAKLYFLFFGNSSFSFNLIVPNIFLYLNLLLIIEIKSKKISKIIVLSIFTSILLNSVWLSYLFFNSLMGEVVVNYLFSVFLVNAYCNLKVHNNKYYFFILGFLYFLKPFSSVLFFIVALYLVFKQKKYSYVWLSMVGFFLNYIYSSLIFENQTTQNLYFRIFLENSNNLLDFQFENIFLILYQEIFIDKVLTLFIIIYIFSKIINTGTINNFNLLITILLINLFFVFILYTTIWKEVELGSAYRYIFSFINIMFLDFQLSVDKKLLNN